MKRVVSSSIITVFILLAVVATFIYLRNFRLKGADPSEAIPTDASFFIIYDPGLISPGSVREQSFWNVLGRYPALEAIRSNLKFLDTLTSKNSEFSSFFENDPIYVSAHVTGATEFGFLFLKNYSSAYSESELDQLISGWAPSGTSSQNRNYDGNNIRELLFPDGRMFTYTFSKGVMIGSFTAFLVEDALRQQKVGQPAMEDLNSETKKFQSTGLDLYVNLDKLPSFFGIFIDDSNMKSFSGVKKFGNWMACGIDLHSQYLALNGYCTKPDTGDFLSVFMGQEPVEKRILEILPSKTAVICYFGASDFKLFYERLQNTYFTAAQKNAKLKLVEELQKSFNMLVDSALISWMGEEMAMVITEPSGLNYDNQCYAVFRVRNTAACQKMLSTVSGAYDNRGNMNPAEETYNGYKIRLIRKTGLLPILFGSSFNRIQRNYYTIIGDYVVFANQASALRTWIDDFTSGSLWKKSKSYQDLTRQTTSQANWMYYIRPGSAHYVIKSHAAPHWKGLIDSYREVTGRTGFMALQFSSGAKKIQMNAVIQVEGQEKKEGVVSVFSVETDTAVNMKPLLFKEPGSSTSQMVFQDLSGAVYVVDNSGTRLNKFEIGNVALGEMHEIDLFRNNSRQYLFNSRDYLFLLDQQGRPVGNYPIRLPARATTGLRLYDNGNPANQRIYVPCENNRVYAYLPSGKPVAGWNFQPVPGQITRSPENIEFAGQKYMLITDDQGGFYFLNSMGELIQKVNGPVVANNSNIYTNGKGGLIYSDPAGKVIIINAGGTVESIPINLGEPDHGFVFADADQDGDPDYIFSGKHELVAYNSDLVLIYRKTFDAELSGGMELVKTTGDKTTLVIRSENSNQTWMLDMNGSPLPGFPVRGSGKVLVGGLTGDDRLNLFVGGSDNRFYVYDISAK